MKKEYQKWIVLFIIVIGANMLNLYIPGIKDDIYISTILIGIILLLDKLVIK